MKLSLSTGSLYVYPLRTVFRMAKQAGLDGVELVVGPEALWRGGAEIGRMADGHHLRIFSLHPPLFPLPGWQDHRSAMGRLSALARELGSPLVVLHPPEGEEWRHPRSRSFLNALGTARRALHGTPIRLALENPGPHPHRQRLLAHPEALRAFADAHDLSLVLDTAHAASLGHSLEQTYQFFNGRLANVHLSDVAESCTVPDILGLHSCFKRHRVPGHGTLPLAGFLRRLTADGYQGLVTLELSPVGLHIWWPPAAAHRLQQAVAWVRGIVGSATENWHPP